MLREPPRAVHRPERDHQMERVKLATCRMSPKAAGRTEAAVPPRDVETDNLSWVKFGEEVVYFGQDQDLDPFVEAASRAGLAPREHTDLIERRRLHVVVQKGRLFQRQHPNVEVLSDKGRFLLVDMDPDEARRADMGDEPCYSVRPLETFSTRADGRNWVVFESHGRAAAQGRDEEVEKCVDLLSRETFEADLIEFVQFPTRFSTSTHYVAACDLVDQRLAALGYTTSRQSIDVNGLPSQNVVARRDGTGDGSGAASRGIVLVTAHLDSINHEGNASSPAPGADDDGSGSAGVIAIARALKDYPGTHDLCLVLFGGEEQGLFGSKQFVASLAPADRARVKAVVNMDMIGTLNTPAPTVLLEGAELSQSVINGLAAAAATYTELSVQTSLNPFNSDHVSFIENGMPAVLTIEGADSANDEIHTARDTLDHINFDLALDILRMNTAFIAESLGRASSDPVPLATEEIRSGGRAS
jgi:hypothetical protein